MNKIYIGIDPGATGALAMINSNVCKVFDFTDGDCLPYLMKLAANDWDTTAIAMIERVHAMPRQGVSSTAKFMTNFGRWLGRLETLNIPYEYITPQKWQKEIFGAMPKIYMMRKGLKVIDTKSMSLECAVQIFPNMRNYLTRKKDNGRSDALLIAEYLRRKSYT